MTSRIQCTRRCQSITCTIYAQTTPTNILITSKTTPTSPQTTPTSPQTTPTGHTPSAVQAVFLSSDVVSVMYGQMVLVTTGPAQDRDMDGCHGTLPHVQSHILHGRHPHTLLPSSPAGHLITPSHTHTLTTVTQIRELFHTHRSQFHINIYIS